jgi:L-lactate utilization protein LutB
MKFGTFNDKGALTPEVKAASLKTALRRTQGFAAILTIIAAGFQINELVHSVNDFDNLKDEFKQNRSAVLGEMNSYVDSLEKAQENFGVM